MYYIIYIYLAIVTCMLNGMEIKYLTNKKTKAKMCIRDRSEPGLERGRTFGAGARKRKDIWSRGSREEGHLEPGLERSRSRGPREEGCCKEYEHEKEEGLKRT